MKRKLVGVSLVVLVTSVAFALTCTYTQSGGDLGVRCTSNSDCATYKNRIAITCTDSGTATGLVPGQSTTNTVTVTTCSGGTCSEVINEGYMTCTGGTVWSEDEVTLVDTPCVDCGA